MDWIAYGCDTNGSQFWVFGQIDGHSFVSSMKKCRGFPRKDDFHRSILGRQKASDPFAGLESTVHATNATTNRSVDLCHLWYGDWGTTKPQP